VETLTSGSERAGGCDSPRLLTYARARIRIPTNPGERFVLVRPSHPESLRRPHTNPVGEDVLDRPPLRNHPAALGARRSPANAASPARTKPANPKTKPCLTDFRTGGNSINAVAAAAIPSPGVMKSSTAASTHH
jgi:hypothetical protein